ncbi:hypothetical protein CBS147353_11686 [Aspergillus niger]|nr:hypothetical protein CBS147353_11686 [Aspergillus niger]
MTNLQRSDEIIPWAYETFAVDCYLSSPYKAEFLTCNGPSIPFPLTQPEDIFRYASAMLSTPIDWLEMHLTVVRRYTLKSVAVLPLFLPRVERNLGNLGNLERCRQQIWEVIRQMPHTMESAPPDDSKPNSQAVSDESMLAEKNDESERAGAWKVDPVVTIELLENAIDVTG